jgi:phosphoglycerol geranylgeranyltransferase
VGRARGIPPNKPSLAVMYALAAEYFGMRFVYLEAGSGADGKVPQHMISAVRKAYSGTLIVGGGITTPENAALASKSGADIVVIGTLLESKDFDSTLAAICKVVSR